MKYQRIRQQLISEIATGAFIEGEAFPSENIVAERFSVSRMTARRALGELEREGYLTRIPGKGNILKKPSFSRGFFTVKPFEVYAEEQNAKASTQLLKAEVQNLDVAGQEKLQVNKAVFVHRLRSLDDDIVLEEQRYLRYDLCSSLLQEDLTTLATLTNESMYDLLIHKLQLPLTRVWQQLNVISLDADKAKLFQCPEHTPAFLLDQVTHTFEKPVTWVRYLYRGDKYSFENEFSPNNQTN